MFVVWLVSWSCDSSQGSHWSTHGHTHSGQLLLEAHETLFLLEMVTLTPAWAGSTLASQAVCLCGWLVLSLSVQGCLEVEMAAGPATLRQVALFTLPTEQTPSPSHVCRRTRPSLEITSHCISTQSVQL